MEGKLFASFKPLMNLTKTLHKPPTFNILSMKLNFSSNEDLMKFFFVHSAWAMTDTNFSVSNTKFAFPGTSFLVFPF